MVGSACAIFDINIDYLILIIRLIFSLRCLNSLFFILFSGIFSICLVNKLTFHESIAYLNRLLGQFLVVFKHFIEVVLQNKVRDADQVVSVLSKAYDGFHKFNSLRSEEGAMQSHLKYSMHVGVPLKAALFEVVRELLGEQVGSESEGIFVSQSKSSAHDNEKHVVGYAFELLRDVLSLCLQFRQELPCKFVLT